MEHLESRESKAHQNFSLKYLSQSSFEEQNRNPSSPKRVHFINLIVTLRKEDEPEEEKTLEPNAAKHNEHNATVHTEEEVIEENEVFDEETEEETKEEEEDDPKYYDTFLTVEELRYQKWLLKNP
ncbi:hypothetical protein Tco_0409439 [Tanacetum coccineum]